MARVSGKTDASPSHSLGAWALVAVINLLLVVLAVVLTIAAALATVGEADSPPGLAEPLFYVVVVIVWLAVGWVAGFLSHVLGAPRGARWSGVAIVAVVGTVMAARSGESPVVQFAVIAALMAAGVVAGTLAVPWRAEPSAPA